MPLYEVAILELPTKKEIEEGTGQEKLVLEPKYVIAKDQQSAAIMAATGENMKIDFQRMQVLVRPFA